MTERNSELQTWPRAWNTIQHKLFSIWRDVRLVCLTEPWQATLEAVISHHIRLDSVIPPLHVQTQRRRKKCPWWPRGCIQNTENHLFKKIKKTTWILCRRSCRGKHTYQQKKKLLLYLVCSFHIAHNYLVRSPPRLRLQLWIGFNSCPLPVKLFDERLGKGHIQVWWSFLPPLF